MLPTKLLYLSDSEAFLFSAKVVDIQQTEQDGVVGVILDQTMFYPRGGGQASDAA